MIEELQLPKDTTLDVEGLENRPVCPVCQEYLEDSDRDYVYRRMNPDTRWFWCPACEGHLGYHRMKRRWKVDPSDLRTSTSFRAYFGLQEGDLD